MINKRLIFPINLQMISPLISYKANSKIKVKHQFFSNSDYIYILGKCSEYKEHKMKRTFLKQKITWNCSTLGNQET